MRKTGRSGRAVLAATAALAILAGSVPAASEESRRETATFRRVSPQYIAALAGPSETAGTGAESWGLWPLDPGPRGVKIHDFDFLKDANGVAPAKWTFDGSDWWLEETGRIMEKPEFPLAPGKYVVTGDREVTAVLVVHAKDATGRQRWELSDGATIHDVTHLGCRSARYTPAAGVAGSCSPEKAHQTFFPVAPGGPMPAVEGCGKQDYTVLIVVGVEDRPGV